MCRWGLVGLAGLLCACPAIARSLPPGCGTHPLKLQEEMFLHRQAARKHPAALRARVASAAQDVGNIAVLDAGGGVVIARNQFDLDRRTLSFLPTSAAASGYRYQLGDPSYDDAAASAGATLPIGDDDSRAVPLPFSFRFFGVAYSGIFVNSDGNLTFNESDPAATEGSLGSMASGAPRIGVLLDDLDPSRAGSTGGIRVLVEPSRFVVTWDHVPEYSDFGTGARQTFQVRIYPDGRIEFAYNGITAGSAVVGIAPGGLRGPSNVISFLGDTSGIYTSLVAERFSNTVDIDIEAAAQKFYQTHDDAYDYLVFYNNMSIAAAPGAVSWESTVRNHRSGYGDVQVDVGAEFGSKSRLQAVLNMGSLSQFPLDPKGRVPARARTGDTPVTILAHETGHLFLAYASIRDANDPNARPMLGFQNAHWVFNFNSDASLLEGNRIRDGGVDTRPEFSTVGTVEAYSPLDQYLMGFIPPDQVEPVYPFGMFLVTGVPSSFGTRLPQVGVTFDGRRRDIHVDELIQAEGRRIPDSTVSQRRYRFAFVVIVPNGATPSAGELAQIETYRTAFEPFYQQASGNHAFADTALRRSVHLSLFPAAGVIAGRTATATISLDTAPATPLALNLSALNGVATVPASITLAAGSTTASFVIAGVRAGVEELSATPADNSYDTAYARVQVSSASALRIATVSGDGQSVSGAGPLPQPVVVRVTDINELAYPGVRVRATATAGGSVAPDVAVTDAGGQVSFRWTPGGAAGAQLRMTVEGAPDVSATVSAMGSKVRAAGVLNAASLALAAAPGMLASIYGENLGGISATATLRERILTVTGGDETRLDFYIPADIPLGAASLVIANKMGTSAPVAVNITAVAPGIYGGFDQPLHAGDDLSIYGTGLGLHPELVQVVIGGAMAAVSYSGPAPGLLGINQVNAQVPDSLASGPQPLYITIQDVKSNEVQIGVE
jgi:uncharacterized protein (TIGR03437 family)